MCFKQLLCALSLSPRKVSVSLVYRVWRARGCSSPLSASLSVGVMIEAGREGAGMAGKVQVAAAELPSPLPPIP